LGKILRQLNSVHILTAYFSKIHFNIILPFFSIVFQFIIDYVFYLLPVEGADDHQLKLAIQLSLQETTKRIAKSTSADPSIGGSVCVEQERSSDGNAVTDGAPKTDEENTDIASLIYHKTSADLTVDYFLKSLAGRQIDLKNLNPGPNLFSPDGGSEGSEVIWGCGVSKTLADKELLIGCGFKPCIAEDGRFEIGDIHENGCFNDVDEYDETDSRLLKRSHSTGDLCTRGRRGPMHGGVVGCGDEPR
jgi:hypothetical protein